MRIDTYRDMKTYITPQYMSAKVRPVQYAMYICVFFVYILTYAV